MDPLFEIELELAPAGSRERGLSLYRQLQTAIRAGRLAAGARLPATRRSALFFGVSRNTATEVYERLAHDGLITTRHGSGTYVASVLPGAGATATPPGTATPPDPRLNPFWARPEVAAAIGFWQDPPRASADAGGTAIDFRPALVDSRLFAFEDFRRVMAHQLRGLERKPAGLRSAQGNQGNYHLRAAITRHIASTRGVACQPDDVLVSGGAQQAFDLLARTLVIPGQTVVAIEDPGYPPLRVAFAAAGARLVPIAVDAEGLLVDRLPTDTGIVCVCPSHQFPLGVSMSPRRRQALLAFARAHRAVVIEDDYDGEFRYAGSPLQALRTADAADVVCYVGTFSKSMLASLRLGFIVMPAWARTALITAKNCLDWHSPTPLQTGVAAFIRAGHLSAHVRRMREVYRQRRQRLLRALERELSPWLAPIPSFYGMHLAAFAREAIDLEVVAAQLAVRQIKLHTLQRYYLGTPTRTGLIFGYGAVDLESIERGVDALREVLRNA